MIQTQYASFKGTTLNFRASDPILGNVSHFSQPLLIAIASGQIEITLQQMMVKNALGQMEPLSSEMQMNADGQVEMGYPSEKITHVLESGSLVEIRPGCAYALNPLTDGVLIQYLLPHPYETPLFNTTVGQIDTEAIDDRIHFELVKKKVSTTTELPVIQPLEFKKVETIPQATPVTEVPDSNQKRYFYREPSTAMLKIGMFFVIPFIVLAFVANMWTPIVAILWFMLTIFCGYWGVINATPHFRNEPTLSIEPDGLIIHNRTYQNLKLSWDQITRTRLDARTTSYENAELVLIIDVVDLNACIPNLNILQRKWLKQLQINDPTALAPIIKLSNTDVDTDLNDLKTLIDSARG